MQTVNEVRLAILENFMKDVSIALQDESDPENLRWRLSEIEATYVSALEVATPKVGDKVKIVRACIDADMLNIADAMIEKLHERGTVNAVYPRTQAVELDSTVFAFTFDEVALCR